MIKVNDLIDDRYKIKASIGHGGMSDVFEGYDIVMKRAIAFKILNEESVLNPQNLIRFENEARIAASLFHPNIVRIYDYGFYKGAPYIVNELQKGQTLKDALTFKKFFSLPEACQIMIQVLEGLAYIHSKGIIHRDIKPQNIFYGSDGIAKIADFGISTIKYYNLNLDEPKKVVGTAQYLAPEVLRGSKPNEQSDIYAAGVTFFELLTGYIPFDDQNVNVVARAHVDHEIPSPLDYMPTLPQKCEDIVKKATSKNLNYRYLKAEDMLTDIKELYDDKKTIKKSTPLITRLFGIMKRNKI